MSDRTYITRAQVRHGTSGEVFAMIGMKALIKTLHHVRGYVVAKMLPEHPINPPGAQPILPERRQGQLATLRFTASVEHPLIEDVVHGGVVADGLTNRHGRFIPAPRKQLARVLVHSGLGKPLAAHPASLSVDEGDITPTGNGEREIARQRLRRPRGCIRHSRHGELTFSSKAPEKREPKRRLHVFPASRGYFFRYDFRAVNRGENPCFLPLRQSLGKPPKSTKNQRNARPEIRHTCALRARGAAAEGGRR